MSNDPDSRQHHPSDAEIDAVLEEFRGDAREAIRALLHDIEVLAGGYEADVSHGFIRGMDPRLQASRS